MQHEFAPDSGRPTVVSTKLPADIVEIIDQYAVRQLLTRAGWLRDAIVAKLEKDVASFTERPDVFGLAELMG